MIALPPVLLVGCGARPPFTVAQYIEQCDALKGKLVSLAGYVEDCGGYSCLLYPDEKGPEQWRRHFGETRAAAYRARDGLPPSGAPITPKPATIGIGGTREFDRKAQTFQNRHVVITGLVDTDSCTGEGGTDRSAGLQPTDIRAWNPPERAPANTK